MKKYLISFAIILSVGALSTVGYYTHKLFVFAKAASVGFSYTYSAIDCLIQTNGQNEADINIILKGFKSRQAYVDAVRKQYPGAYSGDRDFVTRKIYNEHIPECKTFYTEHRCWMLDPYNPKSLDACGKKFGLNQEEIDTMKKDPSSIKKVMDENWKRKTHNED